MNRLDWFAQMLLAGIFLYAGLSRILGFRRVATEKIEPNFGGIALTRAAALAIALLEIAGALGLLVPVHYWQPNLLPRLAAAELSLLTTAALIYHVRRKEASDPVIALFLLTVFVILGQWY